MATKKGVMKTREEIANQYFLNINDIRKLFGISYVNAKRVYDKADEYDRDEFKEFRVDEKKVTTRNVLLVMHLKEKDIRKA